MARKVAAKVNAKKPQTLTEYMAGTNQLKYITRGELPSLLAAFVERRLMLERAYVAERKWYRRLWSALRRKPALLTRYEADVRRVYNPGGAP